MLTLGFPAIRLQAATRSAQRSGAASVNTNLPQQQLADEPPGIATESWLTKQHRWGAFR
jgi:hypothetical protein